MRQIKNILPEVISQACKNHNFTQHKIIIEWSNIVGDFLSSISAPIKTQFCPNKNFDGILIVGISNPGYILELQMMEHLILDKISVYFGYRAINKMRVKYVSEI